ncbi:MAG: hypothetical protein ACW98I_17305 [Candidatus Hodarchaeales archaeon]
MTEIETFAEKFESHAWSIFRDYLKNLINHMEDKRIPTEKQKRILSSVYDFINEFLEERGQDQASIQLSHTLIDEIGPSEEITMTLAIPTMPVEKEITELPPSYERKSSLGEVIIDKSLILIFVFSQFFLSLLLIVIDPQIINYDDWWFEMMLYVFLKPRVLLISVISTIIIELIIFSGLKNKNLDPLSSKMKRMIRRIEISNFGSIIFLYFSLYMILGGGNILLSVITNPELLHTNPDINNVIQSLIVLTPLTVVLGFILYLWNYSYRPKIHTYQSLFNKYRYIRAFDDKRGFRFIKALFGLYLGILLVIFTIIYILHIIMGSSQLYLVITRGLVFITIGLQVAWIFIQFFKDVYYTSWKYIQGTTPEYREKFIKSVNNPRPYEINQILVNPYDTLAGLVGILTYITIYSYLDIFVYFRYNALSKTTMTILLLFWISVIIIYLIMSMLLYRLVDKVPSKPISFRRYYVVLTSVFCMVWGIQFLEYSKSVFIYPSVVNGVIEILIQAGALLTLISLFSFPFFLWYRPVIASHLMDYTSIPFILLVGYAIAVVPLLNTYIGFNPIYVIGIGGIIPLFLLTVIFYLLVRKYSYILHLA